MSAELVVVSSVASGGASIPVFWPILGLFLAGSLVKHVANSLKNNTTVTNNVQSQLEQHWRELEERRRKLQLEEELLKKAKEFKDSTKFESWLQSEVVQYKQLEANFLRKLESMKMELMEKEEKLRSECTMIFKQLTRFGCFSEEEIHRFKNLSGIDKLQTELNKLNETALRVIKDNFHELSNKITTLHGEILERAQEVLVDLQNTINSAEPTPKKLEKLAAAKIAIDKLLEIYRELSSATRGTLNFKQLKDVVKLRENVNTEHELINEIMRSGDQRFEIEILKERIRETLSLISYICQQTGKSLTERFSQQMKSDDVQVLTGVLNELRATYGSLKTKFIEDRIYRQLIQDIATQNKRYQSVQKLACEMLSKEWINDQDYKAFIEELFKHTCEEERNLRFLEERRLILEELIEGLKSKGYEILIDEDSRESELQGSLEESISKGSVIEITPPYSSEHLIKARVLNTGEIVFKFFSSEETNQNAANEVEVCNKWCEDVKSVIAEAKVSLNIKHELEPKRGNIARIHIAKKKAQASKNQLMKKTKN